MKTAIILASSRSSGNTGALANVMKSELNAQLFDLADYQIAPFCYDNSNKDDFLPLVDKLLVFDRLIFATPMYWYSASAQMKMFIDRISDLLSFQKDKGRALRGKSVGLLATGHDDFPADCFEQMFELTFQYLGLNYLGMNYCSCKAGFELSEHQTKIDNFVNCIDR